MTLYSGFIETMPAPRSQGVSRRFARVGEATPQPVVLRHAVHDDTDYPLCDSTLRVVIRSMRPFGAQVGGMNLRTCPRCAALAADRPNDEWSELRRHAGPN
ncbi:hypothetical protein AB0383_45455 [Amycolatopsis sp. NPDC051373]|uniref:hypothetical protein n=1 Tax=Amycolatopsis sp. NPDC051373 TaxID=3155801 RepID=UPI00344F7759